MISPVALNQYRVIPRIAMMFYFYLTGKTASWFMGLEIPTAEQAAFASAVIGAAAAWFAFYVNSGATLKEIQDVDS